MLSLKLWPKDALQHLEITVNKNLYLFFSRPGKKGFILFLNKDKISFCHNFIWNIDLQIVQGFAKFM